MRRASNTSLSKPGDGVLAKLVICVGAAVALATSSTPPWGLEHEQSMHVALADRSTRTFLLTIELGGALYADADGGWAELTVTTDRAASDLTLVIERRRSGGVDPIAFDSDAGAESRDDEGPWVVNFTLESLARASQRLQLACPPNDSEPRQETCIDQLEITLARESARPLQAQLTIHTDVIGQQKKRPRGTFAVSLEEVEP